jgi:hypothetical protein
MLFIGQDKGHYVSGTKGQWPKKVWEPLFQRNLLTPSSGLKSNRLLSDVGTCLPKHIPENIIFIVTTVIFSNLRFIIN